MSPRELVVPQAPSTMSYSKTRSGCRRQAARSCCRPASDVIPGLVFLKYVSDA